MDAIINVAGFKFDVKKSSDAITFNGTTKIAGQIYFARIKVTYRADGSSKIAIGDSRFETFCGKSPRGKANVKLEEMMADAKEFALSFAA